MTEIIIRLHAGFDCSPLPLEFPEAMPGHYTSSVRLFEQFVEMCYSMFLIVLISESKLMNAIIIADDDKLARSLLPKELAAYTTSDAGVAIDEVMDLQEESSQAK